MSFSPDPGKIFNGRSNREGDGKENGMSMSFGLIGIAGVVIVVVVVGVVLALMNR